MAQHLPDTTPVVFEVICQPTLHPVRNAWPDTSLPSTPSGPSLVCQQPGSPPLDNRYEHHLFEEAAAGAGGAAVVSVAINVAVRSC